MMKAKTYSTLLLIFLILPIHAQRILIDDFEADLSLWTLVSGDYQLSNRRAMNGSSALLANNPTYDGTNWPESIIEHNTFGESFGRYEYHFYCDGPASDADIYFQYIDESHYYKVSCKPLGTDNPELVFCKGSPNGEQILFRETPTFGTRQWFKVTIERFCDGHTHVWIDDDLRVDITDLDHLQRGTVRFRAWENETYFDDFYFEPFQQQAPWRTVDTICQGDSLLLANDWRDRSGTYYDTLNVLSQFCLEVAEAELVVLPLDTIYTDFDLCFGDSIEHDNQIIDSAGLYFARLPGSRCDIVDALVVTALDSMEAQDSFTVCTGSEILISPGAFETYRWQDGSILASLPVAAPGTYQVTIGRDQCRQDVMMQVYEECDPRYFIPNAFTPNGDGENDWFQFYTNKPPSQFRLMIFDRWGGLMFESEDYQRGWDGMIASRPALVGTYIYHIQTDLEELSGTLHLVR